MIYYKILNENGFVGIGTENELLKYQKKHGILLSCGSKDAQFIGLNDEIYHDDRWMKPIDEINIVHLDAEVYGITEEEYNTLAAAIETGEQIEGILEEEEQMPVEEVEELPLQEEITVDFVREVKTKEMSIACNRAITDGFDIELSDGELHHFSMTLQDQTNLADAQTQIIGGASEIAYHADGEDYRMYSADEMTTIIAVANQHKLYHLAYFGSLKTWINALSQIKRIQDIEYGTEIPVKYQSTLFRRVSGNQN